MNATGTAPGPAPRVFIYSSEFFPFKGGVGRYTGDLAAMLRDGGAFDVTVFTETARGSHDDGAMPYEVLRAGREPFVRYPLLNILVNAYSGLRALAAARGRRASWFVATGKRSVYNLAFLHPLLGPMPAAIILHGSEWSDIRDAEGWRGRMLRGAFLRLCRRCRRIIIPNRFTLERFSGLPGWDPSKVRLLYPIVDPERVRADAALAEEYRARYFGTPAFSLVTLARLTPRKGQDNTLRALGRFVRESGDARYFMVGNGPYKAALEKLIAEEGLQGKAFILGGLDDARAYALASLCDLYAMPNREDKGAFEGFGIAFLEANVLGVPALAGRNGGSVEAVEEGGNGLLCRGEDPDDIYAALKRYLADAGLRERLKERCRAHALERYSFGRWKTEYQAAFR